MTGYVITWGKWYWEDFLIATGAYLGVFFGIPEIIALFTNVRNTLSDFARYELGADTSQVFTTHNAAWFISLIVFVSVVTELTAHIWFGTWLPQ
jgi:hypothetical protein